MDESWYLYSQRPSSRHYSYVRLFTPVRLKALFLSKIMSHRPVSAFDHKPILAHSLPVFVCMCSYLSPFDMHWHTHTPLFLTSHCCTFLTPDKRIQAWIRIGLQRLLALQSLFLATISGPGDPLSLRSGPRVMIRAGEGWDRVAGCPCLPCDWIALGLLWPIM